MAGRLFYEIVTYDGESEQLVNDVDRHLFSVAGLGAAPVEYITSTGYQLDGQVEQGYRYGPRAITLALDRAACSADRYWALRRRLLDLTRPNRGGAFRFRVHLPTGEVYEYLCRLDSGAEFQPRPTDTWDEWRVDDTFTLLCHDPFPRLLPERVLRFTAGAGATLRFPFTFGGPSPFRFSSSSVFGIEGLAYTGDIWGPIRVVITGPYTYVRLINQSLDPAVEVGLYNSLPPGQQALIDLYPRSWREETYWPIADLDQNLSPVRNLTTGVSLSNWLTPQSDLSGKGMRLEAAPLVPSGVNELQLIFQGTTGESAVEVRYYERFTGI